MLGETSIKCLWSWEGALKIPHIVKSAPNIAEFKSGRTGPRPVDGHSLSSAPAPAPARLLSWHLFNAPNSPEERRGGAQEMTVSERFSAFQWTERNRDPPLEMNRQPRAKM